MLTWRDKTAVRQVLDGTISDKGVLAPVYPSINNPLMKELKENHGSVFLASLPARTFTNGSTGLNAWRSCSGSGCERTVVGSQGCHNLPMRQSSGLYRRGLCGG